MTLRWQLKHARHGNKPWAVQAEAMRRSEGRLRYGDFLEQGLGKTSLNLNEFVCSEEVDVNVVLAPNSFKLDWTLAPAEWGVPGIHVGAWPRSPLPTNQEKSLYAVNYEAARSGGFRPLYDLMRRRRCMLTIDEGSAVKNPSSDTARQVVELAKAAKVVRLLNGTPLVQNVMDYYSQLRCLGELDGWQPLAFRNQFAVMGGYMGRVVQRVIKNEEELYAILNRCSFRALKKDWRKDLPPQIDVPVHLEMADRQHRHYNEMMDDFFTSVDGLDVAADIVLTQMDKLRQISSCLVMKDGHHRFLEEPNDNPKVKAALDIHRGGLGKTIVVYFYRPSGQLLMDAFTKAGCKPARLMSVANMAPEEILAEKRRFNDDPDCRVLVAQQVAAHMAHTLLGGQGTDRCSRMIFYEKSFSYLHWSQMRDRNHRGEQDQACYYYDLITSPMDELGSDILKDKRDLVDSVDRIVAAVRTSRRRA